MQSVEKRGEQLLAQVRSAEQSDLVNQVVAYIDTHYQLDIGVGSIAEQLKITPNYLSAMFHKRTGTTFVRYLTNIRMLKAQELLTDPNLQIQHVAERVGYYSTRYFTKLFAEYTGATPSEYRRMRLVPAKNR
jgi:two-component system response regulator YesN